MEFEQKFKATDLYNDIQELTGKPKDRRVNLIAAAPPLSRPVICDICGINIFRTKLVSIFDGSKGPKGYHLLNQIKVCLGIGLSISDADGSKDGTIVVTHVQTRATMTQRKFHLAFLNTLCYVNCSEPNVLIAGYDNGLLKVFDLRSSSSELSFIGHLDGITCVDPRNDGHHVLSSSYDGTFKIWDSNTRWDCLSPQSTSQHNVNVPNTDASIMTYYGILAGNMCGKFSPKEQTGQRFIYTSCLWGDIKIYDVLTGEIREFILGQYPCISAKGWHPVRSEIVSSSSFSGVQVTIHDCNLDK